MDRMNPTDAQVEAVALAIAVLKHPNGRWCDEKDDDPAIDNRQDKYPLSGKFQDKCTNQARAAIAAMPAPSIRDVDTLAAIIREVDGEHKLGAGVLAEAILGKLGALPAPTAAEAWQPIETAPDLERVLVAGVQHDASGSVAPYWFWHEDVCDGGKAITTPRATHWHPVIKSAFPPLVTPPQPDAPGDPQ